MVDFYGLDIFLAETSAPAAASTRCWSPTGPLRDARNWRPGLRVAKTYFVTNGTATANKVVDQAYVDKALEIAATTRPAPPPDPAGPAA